MRERFPVVVRSLVVLVTALAAVVMVPSCTVSEGDRCNPSRQPDECAEGTACIVPKGCVIAVCCPLVGTGRSANCGPNPPCLVDAAASDDPASPEGGDPVTSAPDATADGADVGTVDASSGAPDASDASAE